MLQFLHLLAGPCAFIHLCSMVARSPSWNTRLPPYVAHNLISLMPLTHREFKDAPADMEQIKDTIRTFLRRWDVAYPPTPDYDAAFATLLQEECTRRGVPLSGPHSVMRFVTASVWLAQVAFAHAPLERRLFVGIFNTLILYVDDRLLNDLNIAREFTGRLVRGESQADPVVEALAQLVREITVRFKESLKANIMVANIINFVSGVLLEDEMKGMTVGRSKLREDDAHDRFFSCAKARICTRGGLVSSRARPRCMRYVYSPSTYLCHISRR